MKHAKKLVVICGASRQSLKLFLVIIRNSGGVGVLYKSYGSYRSTVCKQFLNIFHIKDYFFSTSQPKLPHSKDKELNLEDIVFN